ncbi:MAG TPA: hypothetical protein VGZ93_07740 [Candidatus Methylacidiphilales bacterium]|nr:hypothetical protein [Candidatus Methylacidiphilales bacterium]
MFSLVAVIALFAFASSASAQTNAPAAHPASSPARPPLRKFKALDADNHSILLNRPGLITLVLGTNEDSQDAARAAGVAMYPLRGRDDFQLIVIVDLRDSIATWVPSLVLEKMRSNLDQEAVELKPYFLKNGNKSDPRKSSYVIPDFKGTICPQLGWPETSDDLRGILFGADGREIQRWDKIDDMAKLQTDVRASLQAFIDADKAKAAIAAKSQGSKLIQPPAPHLPLPPLTPPPAN